MTSPARDPGRPPVSVHDYPWCTEAIPPLHLEAGSYVVRFATTPEDLDRVLALRYRIFNLELGEGLDSSHASGRDEDDLDARFHHLMILSRHTDDVVGTYRMQTGEMAAAGGGWYSEGEFTVGTLPAEVRGRAIEIGRACVAREHRNGRVLHLLWRGLAEYLTWNRKSVLFGCCSLTSQDPALGHAVHQHLAGLGAVHSVWRVDPLPDCVCPPADRPGPDPHVPALFQSYLNLGAKVLGPPAIDRAFKTIDWLVILDVAAFDAATFRAFFR
ncbi:MAG: GNAT family N-acetyltransferase [Gemmatimonadales bacterium]